MNLDEITIGEVKRKLVEADELRKMLGWQSPEPSREKPPLSGRAIVVVDRGWIFAGDLSRTPDGYVRLDNAVWVFRWESIGFAEVVKDPSKADIRATDPVEVPEDAIVFRVPVSSNPPWGIK